MVSERIAGWIAHTDDAWWGIGDTPTEAYNDARVYVKQWIAGQHPLSKKERKAAVRAEMARMRLSPATKLAWEWCEAAEGDFRKWRILPNGWFDAAEELYWLEEEFDEERAEIGEQLELRYFERLVPV